jgi:hypothetical protein
MQSWRSTGFAAALDVETRWQIFWIARRESGDAKV